MLQKLKCPKWGNDHFRVSLSESEVVTEIVPGRRKINIIESLHITCAGCGWAKHLYENGKRLL